MYVCVFPFVLHRPLYLSLRNDSFNVICDFTPVYRGLSEVVGVSYFERVNTMKTSLCVFPEL